MLSFGIDDAFAASIAVRSRGLPVGVAAALLRGNRDFANELREQGAALGISGGLVVLDLLPFAMASHVAASCLWSRGRSI
jgi:hypothetical protein